MAVPRRRPTGLDWARELGDGPLDVMFRIALPTRVHLSFAPGLEVPQSRIVPLRIHGPRSSQLKVAVSDSSAPVGKDGAFALRGVGSSRHGTWEEMVVGRLDGRRLLLSIYQCQMLLRRDPPQESLLCSILFRGTSWSSF